MIIRDDIHGEPIAPQKYREFIVRTGGKRPGSEEPLYRLVHTSTRYTKQAGRWTDWDESATLQERGGFVPDGDGGMVASEVKPIRSVVEVREVLKYPHFTGWVIERWCPAYMYGTPENWNRVTLPGHPDVLLLGPYPHEGDYEYVAGPIERLPEFSRIRDAIRQAEFIREQHWGTVEDNIQQRVADAVEEFEAESKKFQEEVAARVKDEIIPMGRVSLAAGRHRQKLADAAGVKEHAGN